MQQDAKIPIDNLIVSQKLPEGTKKRQTTTSIHVINQDSSISYQQRQRQNTNYHPKASTVQRVNFNTADNFNEDYEPKFRSTVAERSTNVR